MYISNIFSPSFSTSDVSAVMGKAPSLCTSIAECPKLDLGDSDPNVSLMSLYEFLSRAPNSFQMHQFVEVLNMSFIV